MLKIEEFHELLTSKTTDSSLLKVLQRLMEIRTPKEIVAATLNGETLAPWKDE
jgi:hypothetical protein